MDLHRITFAKNLVKNLKHERDCKKEIHRWCKDKMTPYQVGYANGYLKGYSVKELEG